MASRRMRVWLAALVGLAALLATPVAAQDVRVRAFLDPREGFTDRQPIRLVIQIEGTDNPGVTLPRLPRAKVTQSRIHARFVMRIMRSTPARFIRPIIISGSASGVPSVSSCSRSASGSASPAAPGSASVSRPGGSSTSSSSGLARPR